MSAHRRNRASQQALTNQYSMLAVSAASATSTKPISRKAYSVGCPCTFHRPFAAFCAVCLHLIDAGLMLVLYFIGNILFSTVRD